MSIIGFGTLSIKKEHRPKFENLMTLLITEMRKKKGCVQCYWSKSTETEGEYLMYSEFDNEENFRNYRTSELMDLINKEIAPLESGASFKYFRASAL